MGGGPITGAKEDIPQLPSLFPSDSCHPSPIHVASTRVEPVGKNGSQTAPIGRGLWEREEDGASEVTGRVCQSMALTALERRSGAPGQPTYKPRGRPPPSDPTPFVNSAKEVRRIDVALDALT